MNIYITDWDGKRRVSGRGISLEETMNRIDNVSELLAIEGIKEKIQIIVKASKKVPGYFICIRLSSKKDAGNFLCIYYRRFNMKEKRKERKVIAAYNLRNVNSSEIWGTIFGAITAHQNSVSS